ncbi:hypothetical protein BDP27DRAFT_1370618 [Rhodocollybia butyracea]|uniref:Uncharacterized protein n=1 Tax=Rhodocollybia butyracea TaxID=206335 RepID=A0A9P5TZG7_9AGAR|nr:hypothetical protein BDP27DRAFT_1370618 [Rhodocollybia butyracea]
MDHYKDPSRIVNKIVLDTWGQFIVVIYDFLDITIGNSSPSENWHFTVQLEYTPGIIEVLAQTSLMSCMRRVWAHQIKFPESQFLSAVQLTAKFFLFLMSGGPKWTLHALNVHILYLLPKTLTWLDHLHHSDNQDRPAIESISPQICDAICGILTIVLQLSAYEHVACKRVAYDSKGASMRSQCHSKVLETCSNENAIVDVFVKRKIGMQITKQSVGNSTDSDWTTALGQHLFLNICS